MLALWLSKHWRMRRAAIEGLENGETMGNTATTHHLSSFWLWVLYDVIMCARQLVNMDFSITSHVRVVTS